MSIRSRNIDRSKRIPTFIKAWRLHLGLSQQKVVDGLADDHGISLTTGQLSRIERGEQPYAQDVLEALGRVFRKDPADLLTVDPANPYESDAPRPLLTLWAELEPDQRLQAMDLLKIVLGKPRQ